jgi:hypothetical protein
MGTIERLNLGNIFLQVNAQTISKQTQIKFIFCERRIVKRKKVPPTSK